MTPRDALTFLSDRYGHTVESDGEDNWERFSIIEAALAAPDPAPLDVERLEHDHPGYHPGCKACWDELGEPPAPLRQGDRA